MRSLGVSLLLCLLTSCSTLKTYSTPGLNTVYVGLQDQHGTPIEVYAQRDFYLWGLIPSAHHFDLVEEFEELGAVSIARVTYTQERTWSQQFLSFLSLGMYWPVQVRFNALAKMNDKYQEYEEGRWR